ncbi:hypothetical protein CU097_010472 [Rhizopus azygosporus]|uniref:chitin synthase n=1 Tax=Rhizopus azygosporus TaxID=86630 RepID=A0A367JPI1_RHIAZ|nr:hypothetical protein CU097_010472 [Rhizopus azygosporus]
MALLSLFLFSATCLCFWLEYVSSLFCNPIKYYYYRDVLANNSKLSVIHGTAVDWSGYSSDAANFIKEHPHQDLSYNFPRFLHLNQSNIDYNEPILNNCIYSLNMTDKADAWLKYYLTKHPGYDYQDDTLLHCPIPGKLNMTGAPCFDGTSAMDGYRIKGGKVVENEHLHVLMTPKIDVLYDPFSVKKYYSALPSTNNMTRQAFVILDGTVLDVTAYLLGATDTVIVAPHYTSRSFATDRTFLPTDLSLYLYTHLGTDISDFFDSDGAVGYDVYRQCLIYLFQTGVSHISAGCARSNPAMWATLGIGLIYFFFKINLGQFIRIPFIQRIISSSAPEYSSSLISQSQGWPYTLLMVPCFAESSDTLKQTLDALARSSYDDAKKLLLFVCDGVAVNDKAKKETYKLLLESLGYSSFIEEPIPRAYISLGQGKRRINYAKVYSGYYETGRNRVPYLVIVKIGNPKERLASHPAPPGNRGKRDSLVMIFGFLERCMNLSNNLITPLDYEIFNQCYNVLGIDPRYFKYLMMTDADVQVQSDVVHKLVLRLEHDCKMLAVSGHVRPANPEENLITMMQIFAVYMDFFSGLAYEACFRSVKTINGGLVMFKIWSEKEPLRRQRKNSEQEETANKWPKISDEIIITNPFADSNMVDDSASTATISSAVYNRSVIRASRATIASKLRPDSRLNLSPSMNVQACCVHPTVLRGICTPQPNTMHMQNVLLLGEERYLSIVLLVSHPDHRLGFAPDAEGYATLANNFFALQALQTRHIRAAFHIRLEMLRVSWRLGFSYWILSCFEIVDTMFSIPTTVYVYIIFVRSVKGVGMSNRLFACAFGGLLVLHVLIFFVSRRKYIIWFALYCVLSVPLFSIWFPVLALWQSDYAGRWYDVWPVATLRHHSARRHGILEDESAHDQTTGREEDTKDDANELARLTLSQFDAIEMERQRQAAEAALDSNFEEFSASTQHPYKSGTSHAPDSPTAIYSPPTAQIWDGLRSTRIAYQHTATSSSLQRPNRQPTLDTTHSRIDKNSTTTSNPFDDDYSTVEYKKPVDANHRRWFNYSHSSVESSKQEDHWTREEANEADGTNELVLEDDCSLDDRGSTLSIISDTFSIMPDQGAITQRQPTHRFDPSVAYTPQTHLPEEGRVRAIHTNLNQMASLDGTRHMNLIYRQQSRPQKENMIHKIGDDKPSFHSFNHRTEQASNRSTEATSGTESFIQK